MTELPPHPGTPRWVKIIAIVALIVLVVFVIVHLAGGGFRRHGSISTVTEHRSYPS